MKPEEYKKKLETENLEASLQMKRSFIDLAESQKVAQEEIRRGQAAYIDAQIAFANAQKEAAEAHKAFKSLCQAKEEKLRQ